MQSCFMQWCCISHDLDCTYQRFPPKFCASDITGIPSFSGFYFLLLTYKIHTLCEIAGQG